LLSVHQNFIFALLRLHCAYSLPGRNLGRKLVEPAKEEDEMKGFCRTTIAIFGALLLGLACNSSVSAECGSPSLSHPAPAAWRPSATLGRAHLAATSYALVSTAERDGDEDEQSIVGMWHVTFTAKGNGSGGPPDNTPIDNALVVWHNDKTEVMNSGRPPQDGEICLGVWERTGRCEYRLNHFGWGGYDTTNAPLGIGNPIGPTHITEEVTLSPDGKHFAGRFTLDAYDTSGNQTAHIIGVIKATRVTVDTTVGDLL